jgi:amidohydrolase/hippurate hydrolase
MEKTMDLRELKKKAEAMSDHMTALRRRIHTNPELGFQEKETTALVRKELSSLGVVLAPLDLDTGVVGLLKGRRRGPEAVTALRADMDALPIAEKTGLAYASQTPGVMHACGHDGHVAMLLGAAGLLSAMQDAFSGTVKFLFQPAEELLTGAKRLIDAKCLKDPEVDRLVAVHGWPDMDVGKIGVYPGPYMASADRFEVSIQGAGGHGGYPHRTRDPVIAAAHSVVALQSIISRETDPLDQAVLSVCTLSAGRAFNVIPDQALLGGTVRCLERRVRADLQKKMMRVVEGVPRAFGCEGRLDWTELVPPLVNDSETSRMISEAGEAVLGQGCVERLPGPVMGSEDFAAYLQHVPRGALFRVGLKRAGCAAKPLHHSGFDFNDEALSVGASVLAGFVLRFHGSQE